jgi:hypothetical protein
MKKIITGGYLTTADRCTRILKAIMVTLALSLVCGFSHASPKPDHELTKEKVIDTYLNAVVHGNLDNINGIIDDNARFYIQRNVRVLVAGKSQMLDYLKGNAHVERNCCYSAAVLQKGDNFLVEKVEMKYADVICTEVITAQLSDTGWKITRVEASFK